MLRNNILQCKRAVAATWSWYNARFCWNCNFKNF